MFNIGDKVENIHVGGIYTITKKETVAGKTVYQTDEPKPNGRYCKFNRFNSNFAHNWKKVRY